MLHFTAAVGPPVWMRRFSSRVGMIAATVGPLTANPNYHYRSTLFRTPDGGHHWLRFPLPVNYAVSDGSITFPDPRHGWLWYGDGASGSMSVSLYRTIDGGRRWSRVACTDFSLPAPGHHCGRSSGIAIAGDKGLLTFKDAQHGWLTADEHSGIPDIYRTADGGRSWRRQPVALPSGVGSLSSQSTTFASGTFLQPRFFGRIGVLPEEVDFYRTKPQASWNRLSIFRSTDGGRTWNPAPPTPVTGPLGLWQALDARHWLFTTSAPRTAIWSTSTGGGSWSKGPLRPPAGLTLVGFWMSDMLHGWAIAQQHADLEVTSLGTVLLRTSDGGRHWRAVKLP